jgi:hypothetical protein
VFVKLAAALILVLSVACVMWGQSPQTQPAPASSSAPSQQQSAMGYFAGPWKITGTTKISPTSPAVEFNATASGEWLPGNYFLEVKTKTHGPLGDIHTVRMMEYNASDSVYTFNEYNSLGEHVIGIGKIDGQKWVWNTTKKLNGVTVKGRYITTYASSDAYSYKSQVQNPSGSWVTITEGTATRLPPQNQ